MKWSCPKCKWIHYYRDIFTKRDKIRIKDHLWDKHKVMIEKGTLVPL